ncbi:MAG: GNAT family N-acetyltransferase [Acidobacteriaceae bacterium]|nr:GNAT family N-acetyltransferase [Acidobacteriaceae bacterium]
MSLSAPEPLASHHEVENFHSGEPSLDEWLKKRARANQAEGASRTFVVCEGSKVLGYYALASGSVGLDGLPGRFRRNMPNPVPVVMLGRLAVDLSLAGRGVGRGLFKDAALRVSNAADTIGIRGIAVHPLSDGARAFYRRLGFTECPGHPALMVVTLKDVRVVINGSAPD